MKPLSQRERLMITALPAAVVLMAYQFFIAAPINKDLKTLKKNIEKASTRQPSPQDEINVATEIKALESRKKALSASARDHREMEKALAAYWNNADAENRVGEFISNLLTSKGIILVEETLASTADTKKFGATLAQAPNSKLWKLRMAGTFIPVSEVLATLGSSDLPILPLAIEMEPLVDGNKSIHLWNLWIVR